MPVFQLPGIVVAGSPQSVCRERRLRRVLDLIQLKPSSSVSDLAQEARVTPTHLQRLFKQQLGVNVGDLLAEHRLRIAAYLLSTSDLSIKEISHRVGYEHHSSFVRAFQRRFSQTPKKYRIDSDTLVLSVPNG